MVKITRYIWPWPSKRMIKNLIFTMEFVIKVILNS